MKNKIVILFSLFCFAAKAQTVVGVDTIWKSGPISNRINIVILGDGYDNTETAKLVTDATNTSTFVLNNAPFIFYQNYFNVFVIKCVSPQSGITHPGTATDVSEPASPVTSVTNYFNTGFDSYNIHRLMVPVNGTAIFNVLSTWFPAYSQVVVLGNTPEYGGSGGFFATASTHPSSAQILLHEIGHSFAGLADEYWAGLTYAAEKPNMTANSNSVTVKWNQWMGWLSTGVYPYGTSSPENGWFRPHQNCGMRYLNQAFCSVCKQTIIEKIHSLVNPIDAYYPSNTSSITFTSGSQWFKTVQVKTMYAGGLKTTSELNSTVVSNNTDSVLINSGSLIPGTNTLKVTVIDTSTLSRDVNHPALHSHSVIWNIDNFTGIAETKVQMEYSIFPNPASNLINLKYYLKEEANVGVSITDAAGKKLISKKMGKQSPGEYRNEIDVSELSAGNYFLNIQINNTSNNNQFVVYK